MTGRNARYIVGLIGSGITGSLTPALHEREADALGLRYLYQILDIDDIGGGGDELCELIVQARRLGYCGLNITHPCKQVAVRCVDALSPAAASLQAVNTVTFGPDGVTGHNTDWFGFQTAFARGLPDLHIGPAAVVGAGGAGAAVCFALLTLGAERLTVIDVDRARADALGEQLAAHFGDRIATAPPDAIASVLEQAEGVANASPVGMAAHPGTPFDPDLLDQRHWVADVIYRPLETELVQAARERGCRTLTGGGMAVFQAVSAFQLFTGLEPDAERMLLHFEEMVARESATGPLSPSATAPGTI